MSYNSQVESYVVGDLVYFTGYDDLHKHESNHLGIIISVGNQSKAFRRYEVFWLQSGITVTIGATHLELAYVTKF